jgi:excisionase family DNA binding protein
MERIAYPIKEAAHVVGVSRTRIFEAVRKEELTVRKAGRVSIVTRDDLLAWIRSLPTRGRPSENAAA